MRPDKDLMSLRILFASDVSTGTGKESTVGEITGDDGRGEDWDDFFTRRLVLPDLSLKEPDFCRRGDRVVAVGSVNDDWMVRCYDAHSGAVRWSQSYSLLGESLPGVYDAPIQVAMDDATVVVAGYGSTKAVADELYPKASRDWVVRAYDVETGRLLWSDHSGSPSDTDEANGGVVLIDGRAYVLGFLADAEGAPHTLLRAYDSRSGRVVWNDELSRTSFPGGVTITLAASEGRLTAVSYVNGTRPPGSTGYNSVGVDLLVRTYQIGDDRLEHRLGN